MNLAEALAGEALRSSGTAPIPPIDLTAVAASYGVTDVVELDTLEDGRVETTRTGSLIVLRRDALRERKRFTLAHEIAHLLLRKPDPNSPFHRALPVLENEEKLCDDIAAALLMPAGWVQQRFRVRRKNLSTVRHLAHLADCSLSAALARLNEVCGWRHALLRFERHEQRWRLVGQVGVASELHGSLRSNRGTDEALAAAGLRGAGDRTVELPLVIRGSVRVVKGQASVGSRAAILLTHLTDDP